MADAPKRTKPRKLSYEEPWSPINHYGSREGPIIWFFGAIWRAITFRRVRGNIEKSRTRRRARRRDHAAD